MTDKITIERETLLPCPFCGGAPSEPKEEGGSNEQSGYNFTIRIACTGCAASIQRGSVHDKNGWCNDTGQALASAIAAWNLRAALAQKAEPQPVAWVSADSPPTEKQEYVHDLLVRNKYGNVDIGTYDGYAKYFEVGNSTRLGGWPVVEWMFLPQTIIEGSKP